MVRMDQTFMIVDDEKTVRDVLGSVLSREGYKVSYASDGDEALDTLSAKSPQAFEYILCDIKMPRVNGLEFLR
jgi:two-component system nitrogen regulation response regulator NtrX